MPLKATPNHAFYIETLRRMGPEARLMKAFELSEFAKSVFLDGLRQTFPHLPEQELRRLALDRLAKCHNRNYDEWSRCSSAPGYLTW